MSAQSGHNVALGYGPQGGQQSGASILLSYSPPASARRTIVGGISSRWSAARLVQHEQQLPTQHSGALDVRNHASWGRGRAQHSLRRQIWLITQSAQTEQHSFWGVLGSSPLCAQHQTWGISTGKDVQAHTLWGRFANYIARVPMARWVVANKLDRSHSTAWGQYVEQAVRASEQAWATARHIDQQQHLPWWRFSRPLAPGWGVVTPDGRPPTDENGTVLVPILRSYIVLNQIALHRLDTGAELHAHGFSMSLDYQSWTWQWSASLHHDAASHLGRDTQDDPPVLVAVVNGQPFHLRLEKTSRDRRFMPTRWAVSGRGLAATLATPWAPKMYFGNTEARTAQQLANDVLTINNVSLGWAVDWGTVDWLVPAGAWAMQGSYIEALTDIAGSVGGYVQPHATDAVLRVLPKYPAAPWEWATALAPDFELPAAVGEVEGTEYINKPAYNGIYVGGQGAGVFGPVTRAGTAGEVLAPQVLHPLITHADAHRARGLAELADTGTQEHITLTMQVLPETGVITPGQVIRYLGHDKDYLGLVRSTAINWSSPKLRQTLLLETHA